MPAPDLPQIGSSLTASAGVTAVTHAVENGMGWLFRPQPEHDFGVDGHIEVVTGSPRVATGRLISVQIKAGDSFFREGDEVGWHVYIPKPTVNYWLRGSLPHILVLVRPRSGKCFWTEVRPDGPGIHETADSYRITVPRNQRLDARARDALLDLDAGPFLGTERFFRGLLDRSRAYHHARPLVGRGDEFQKILAAAGNRFAVVELAGRGGIGKTRLLLEVARQLQDAGWACRWVGDHVTVTAAAARQIPPGRVVLFADDVHLRSDLPAICELAKRRSGQTVLVLGLRPWARPMARSALAGASIPLDEVCSIQLGELRRTALIPLLRDELGPALVEHAELLAANLGDSTLVSLAAARFLRDEQIAPALLERSAAFRHEVLTRFEDAVLGDFSGQVDAGRAKALLRLVSVTGPVLADDAEWVQRAAGFLGIPPFDLVELLGILEAGEVLVRRDARVRVIPDVLSDRLVHVATITETGRLTGYPRSILDHFGPPVLPQLVTNLSELDWRLAEVGEPAAVLDDVWAEFREAFSRGDNYKRLHFLYALRPVAAIQPRRVFELCRWLVDHPNGDTRGHDILADTRVLDATLPLLAEVLDDERHFVRAATLMYRIGRDRRTPDPLSDLRDRVAHHPQQPEWVQEKVVECLEAWTAELGWAEHAQTPLILADTLLRKEEIFVLPRGRTFRIAPHPIPPEVSSETRLRTIALLGNLARGPSARGRILAVDSLLTALRPPPRSLGRTVDADETAGWLPQDLTAIAELEVAAASGDALVRIRIRDALSDLDAHSDVRVARAAAAAAGAIAETSETALLRAWSGFGPHRPRAARVRQPGRRPRARVQRTAYMRAAARQLTAGRAASAVVADLAAAESAYSAAGLDSRPDELLDALASVAPDLAVEAAGEIAERGGSLAGRVGALLNGIARKDRRAYRVLLGEYVRAGGSCLRSVANGLARAVSRRTWTAYESEQARSLAHSDDAIVRGHILHAVALGQVEPRLALALLSSTFVGADLWLGELFASAADVVLDRGGGIIDRSAAASLLDRLAGVPRFTESDAVTRFLANAASRWPDLLMDFVVRRIGLIEAANRVDETEAEDAGRPRALYRAVPRGDWAQVWTTVRSSDGYARALAKIRDEIASAEGESQKELLHVFHELSDVDDQTADVLLEWLESGDRRLVEATMPLLEQLPHAFVFARPDIAARALDAAYAFGTDAGAGVSLALGDSLQPRIGFRGNEYVGHLEWTRQRAETCAAEVRSEHATRFYRRIAEAAASGIEHANARDYDDDADLEDG